MAGITAAQHRKETGGIRVTELVKDRVRVDGWGCVLLVRPAWVLLWTLAGEGEEGAWAAEGPLSLATGCARWAPCLQRWLLSRRAERQSGKS